MFSEILKEAWNALRRNPLRSFLTMLGMVWGIAAVTLLMAYGNSFRHVLVTAFEAFGKSAVVCWPGQTSQQAGGERAGKRIRFELADLEAVRNEAYLIKLSSLETVNRLPVTVGDRQATVAVRGVYPEYGEIRNERPSDGRWISAEDFREARRVAVLGSYLHNQLFGKRPAAGETIRIAGVRFTVIGTMDAKLQISNYFSPDDRCAFIPYTAASQMWNTRYASVLVFAPVAPRLERAAIQQFREILAKRQRFSPTDQRAFSAYGRDEVRPIIDGITIGLQVLLLFIGVLTLGIGGVGLMNIMLVSVNERVREIGLRRAMGARRAHIRTQFLAEALAITLAGGIAGMALSYALAAYIGGMPMLGALFHDESGRGDLYLRISPLTLAVSTAVLLLVGLLSGVVPALKASRLDPCEALRYE